jgi:uncharacterized membrane protein YfcA
MGAMLLVRVGAGIGHAVSLPALVAVGLVVGYVAGMFGVGGGFLLTPVLMYGFGVPPAVAVGSALCQQCGTSAASFLRYRSLGRGEPRIDLVMVGGSLIGIDAGTRLLAYLSGRAPVAMPWGPRISVVNLTLDVLFLVLLTATAAFTFHEAWNARRNPVIRGDVTIPGKLATSVRIPPYIDLPRAGLRSVSVPLLCYLGFLLGLASGVMGIGGGVLLMPVLLYGFGMPARNAAGTGILLLLATVALGTFEQALHGYVSLKLSLAILVGSSIGSQLGALTTNRLRNRVLRLLFSFLVAGAAAAVAWNLFSLLVGRAVR